MFSSFFSKFYHEFGLTSMGYTYISYTATFSLFLLAKLIYRKRSLLECYKTGIRKSSPKINSEDFLAGVHILGFASVLIVVDAIRAEELPINFWTLLGSLIISWTLIPTFIRLVGWVEVKTIFVNLSFVEISSSKFILEPIWVILVCNFIGMLQLGVISVYIDLF